jgi:hypothetical protein
MLILIVSLIAAAVARLILYKKAENRLHVKNLNIESQK